MQIANNSTQLLSKCFLLKPLLSVCINTSENPVKSRTLITEVFTKESEIKRA